MFTERRGHVAVSYTLRSLGDSNYFVMVQANMGVHRGIQGEGTGTPPQDKDSEFCELNLGG